MEDRRQQILAALSQMDKQFGKGSVLMLGSKAALPVEVITTGSIAIDSALGAGGFPRGRVIEIFGPESSGKTTLALHVIAVAFLVTAPGNQKRARQLTGVVFSGVIIVILSAVLRWLTTL